MLLLSEHGKWMAVSCCSTCTPVPVPPWGSSHTARSVQALVQGWGRQPAAGKPCWKPSVGNKSKSTYGVFINHRFSSHGS